MIQELKRKIVLAAYAAKEGHIASAFSILDILYVLYTEVMQPEDRFILSKGHASLALYAVLGSDLTDFGKYDSLLGGHPDRNKVPGVVASTGSLGHGLPMAVGIALARKIKSESGRVFCLVGDGECNEGSVWESILLASQHDLDNLTVIVDNNHSTDRSVNLTFLGPRFGSFGFAVSTVDGHDHAKLQKHLNEAFTRIPRVVIADTVKGKGCARMENNPEWHHKFPNSEELTEILAELS